MGRRSLFVVGLALALVCAAPAAGDDIEDQKAAVDARVAALQADIAASQAQEGVLTSQLSAVVSELEAAQDAVDEAETSLGALEAELATEQTRLMQLTVQLGRQQRRLERQQAEYARVVGILESRVRRMYIDEPPDVLSFLVSASSFDEVIDNVEFLSRINAQDRRIARQVDSARRRAAAERRATADTRRQTAATVSVISARTDEARSVRDRLAANRDTLAAAGRLRQSAIEGSRESRDEYLAEVTALEAQSAALAATIRGSQAGSSIGSSGSGAASSAGFIWPVNGVVVSGFGMRWGRMHQGIDIAASVGTPIRAAATGTAIYAGWLGGYGNLVVLDHGNGLATAYAHASSIFVAVGQQVSQGQTVSLVGTTGHSTGPHLHFEVRVNGVAVDPLPYL